jgi:hypothetical protein
MRTRERTIHVLALSAALALGLGACGVETQRAAAPPPRVPDELPGRYLIELGAVADRDAPESRWMYLELFDDSEDSGRAAISAHAWRPDGQALGVTKVSFRRGELTLGLDRAYDIPASGLHAEGREVIERWLVKARLRSPAKNRGQSPWLRGIAKLQIESVGSGEDDWLESTHSYRFVADRADDVDPAHLRDRWDDQNMAADLESSSGSVAPAIQVDPAQTYMPKETTR